MKKKEKGRILENLIRGGKGKSLYIDFSEKKVCREIFYGEANVKISYNIDAGFRGKNWRRYLPDSTPAWSYYDYLYLMERKGSAKKINVEALCLKRSSHKPDYMGQVKGAIDSRIFGLIKKKSKAKLLKFAENSLKNGLEICCGRELPDIGYGTYGSHTVRSYAFVNQEGKEKIFEFLNSINYSDISIKGNKFLDTIFNSDLDTKTILEEGYGEIRKEYEKQKTKLRTIEELLS